jgi:predicted Holliday junction resolvase-like endonuclease
MIEFFQNAENDLMLFSLFLLAIIALLAKVVRSDIKEIQRLQKEVDSLKHKSKKECHIENSLQTAEQNQMTQVKPQE